MIGGLFYGSAGGNSGRRMSTGQFHDRLRKEGISSKAIGHIQEHIEGVVGDRYHEIPHNLREITRGLRGNKGLSHSDIRKVGEIFSQEEHE